MRDKMLLVAAGCVAAVGAWGFWHFTGEYGFSILNLIIFGGLFLENRNLRKRLNKLTGVSSSVSPLELNEKELAEVRELISAGKDIPAMTLIRQKTGAGLAEAKELVETIKAR